MSNLREFNVDPGNGPAVRGFLHSPEQASEDGLVLTHGAGANCRSPLLTTLANAFCDRGLTVLRFDLPFRQLRPHGPPSRGSASLDQEGVRAAIDSLRKIVPGKVFAGGHSYGGRQTTMLAASNEGVASGLLLLSYPLHPPTRPTEMRTAHFPKLKTPSLFVHGSKDGFGSEEEMSSALKLIPAQTKLVVSTGSGHELLNKTNQQELPAKIVGEFCAFFGVR
jgi:hypothetical protein